MTREASAVLLDFSVPHECSVGVLYQKLHRGEGLAPLRAELNERACATQVFDGLGLYSVMLHARVNDPVGKNRVRPTGVVVDSRWRMLDRDTYWAHVDVDLSPWTPKSKERTAEEAWAGAYPILRHAAWLGFAQAAIELGVARERIEAFLYGSPASPNELQPRSRRRRPKPRRESLLEIQILYRASNPNDQLAERHRLGEVLADTAARSKLGVLDGGSSSDEHFEFAYRVEDAAKARARFLDALEGAGVEADAISFHDGDPS